MGQRGADSETTGMLLTKGRALALTTTPRLPAPAGTNKIIRIKRDAGKFCIRAGRARVRHILLHPDPPKGREEQEKLDRMPQPRSPKGNDNNVRHEVASA